MRVHHQENHEKIFGGTRVLVPGHQNSDAPYVPDWQSNHKVSTPPASKVHCSINGLKNSSSPEYSKVQQFFGIAVADFTVGGEFLTLRFNLSQPYRRTFQPCIKRKQGYKGLILHLATRHQQLKEVLCPFLWKQILYRVLSHPKNPKYQLDQLSW